MKRFWLLLAVLIGIAGPAVAQQNSAKVIATCGTETIPLTPGNAALRVNQAGQLCTTGTGGGGAGDASAANQTAVQAPVAAGAATATKSNLVAGQYLSSLPTMTNTQQGALTFDVNGRLLVLEKNSADLLTAVQAAIPAGTNLIGDVNLRQGGTALSATNGTFANVLQGNAVLSITNPSFIRDVAGATGGASTTGNIAANNTTAVVVKASPGTVYGAQLSTIGAVPLYLKLYNATSATCGSGTPVKRLIVPKAGTAADGGGSNVSFGSVGVDFSTGITYCITGGIADNDTTAPAASVALVNIDWK